MSRLLYPLFLLALPFGGISQKGSRSAPVPSFGNQFEFASEDNPSPGTIVLSSTLSIPDTSLGELLSASNRPERPPSAPRLNSPLLLGIKLNAAVRNYHRADVRSISKYYASYAVPDSSEAKIIALAINPENIKDYQYRVVLNDSIEAVKWSPVTNLEMKYGARQPYANIGTFRYPGHIMMVEVAHKDNYGIRYGYLVDFRNNKRPEVLRLVALRPHMPPVDLLTDKRYTKETARETGLSSGFVFPKDSIIGIDLHVKKDQISPHFIFVVANTGKRSDTTRFAQAYRDGTITIPFGVIYAPGQYEVIVQRTEFDAPEDERTSIHFTVEEAPFGLHTLKQPQTIRGLLAGFLLFTVAFLLYRNYARRKLRKNEQQKQQISLRLNSIKGQLNPHFLFNAISSIQNLVQKKDVETANHYLSTFASLTRTVLASGDREMNALSHEIEIVRDYLEMEQLRFGFHYEILESLQVNSDLVEIPPLLLQPFAENAVKHGISALREKGKITIRILQEEENLILEVEDNGNGFSLPPGPGLNGYGIRLTRERIALLNQMYPGQEFELSVLNLSPGTKATIQIKNWISL